MSELKFDIMTKPWWYKWETIYDIDKELNNIKYTTNIIKNFINESNNHDYFKGHVEYHYIKYLKECVISEHNINLSISELENIINHKELDNISTKNYKKIKNIYNIIVKLFPVELNDHDIKVYLNIKYCKKFHAILGNDVIDNAGKFRIKQSGPIGYDLVYLHPALIDKKLTLLFNKVYKILKSDISLLEHIKLVGYFISNFLFIHPFTNGNGRLCRIYASLLLKNVTSTPMSLFINKDSRDIYLECIYQSQINNSPPSALCLFILECIKRNNNNVISSLDLN